MPDERSRKIHTGWIEPRTPQNLWPRRARELAAGSLGMFGQTIIGVSPQAEGYLVPGQDNRNVPGAWGGGGAKLVDGVAYRTGGVATPGSKTTGQADWDAAAIHGFMDPTGPILPFSAVATDMMYVDWTSGVDTWFFFGWFAFNTAHDETSIVGVGWTTNGTDKTWVAYVNVGTATPSTSLHSDDTGVSSATAHQMGIALDGFNHQVNYYIDGVLYSTFTPSVVPAQFGTAGVLFGHAGVHDTTSTGYLYHYGGTNPRLLALIDNGAP